MYVCAIKIVNCSQKFNKKNNITSYKENFNIDQFYGVSKKMFLPRRIYKKSHRYYCYW